MATKFFIVSFEGDSKIIYRSLLQNSYICFTSGDIYCHLNNRTVRHLGLIFNLINNVLVTSQQGKRFKAFPKYLPPIKYL